jgi:hypothetical protein
VPKYSFVFDTAKGKIAHRVTVEDMEVLADVLPGIIDELRERDGTLLRGDGNPQVIHAAKVLNSTQALSNQGVLPGDELLVTCIVRNG